MFFAVQARRELLCCVDNPSKYVPSLIGQTKSGTHIIYYAEKRKIIQYYEVMSLKNDTLTLGYYADDAIGWSAGYVVLTFRRVKE